jgi:hypothetical protein
VPRKDRLAIGFYPLSHPHLVSLSFGKSRSFGRG